MSRPSSASTMSVAISRSPASCAKNITSSMRDGVGRGSRRRVLLAHKGQPMIEKRLEQVKTVHEIAPVFLKAEGRFDL